MVETADDLTGYFNGQLEKCGVEYIDYYLLHALNKSYYEKAKQLNAFDFVAQKKEEGKPAKIGFTRKGTSKKVAEPKEEVKEEVVPVVEEKEEKKEEKKVEEIDFFAEMEANMKKSKEEREKNMKILQKRLDNG